MEIKRSPNATEKRNRAILRHRPTKAENRLRALLDDCEIEYTFQKIVPVSPYKARVVDFYFRKAKLMVEVDGKYHDTFEQQMKDIEREFELKAVRKGWSILHITNSEIYHDPEGVIESIKLYL